MTARVAASFLLALSLTTSSLHAQDRETKVRQDRARLAEDEFWIYNDLEQGIATAKETGKPLLVVFRCIPCEACAEFDEEVVRRAPEVSRLMAEFVCVRIVHANGMDLSLFQFDFDQSFHAILMNADKTVYGRFGTRSESKDESRDITMEGFARALEGALALHKEYPKNREALAGKQAPSSPVRVPEEFPSLKGKYTSKLDYEGKVVQNCIHCHQVREAERLVYRAKGEPIPDRVLFPYPLPQTIGLTLDSRERATVKSVAEDTPASRAGLQPEDELLALEGQRLLSIADVQWILHNADSEDRISAEVVRGGKSSLRVMIELPEGWRRTSDISWRPTSWDLRRMATGGLVLEALSEEEHAARKVDADSMALRVKHVGQYGEHAVAKNAGFRKDDIVVAFDGRTDLMTETDVMAYALQDKDPGGTVTVTVLREDERVELRLPIR